MMKRVLFIFLMNFLSMSKLAASELDNAICMDMKSCLAIIETYAVAEGDKSSSLSLAQEQKLINILRQKFDLNDISTQNAFNAILLSNNNVGKARILDILFLADTLSVNFLDALTRITENNNLSFIHAKAFIAIAKIEDESVPEYLFNKMRTETKTTRARVGPALFYLKGRLIKVLPKGIEDCIKVSFEAYCEEIISMIGFLEKVPEKTMALIVNSYTDEPIDSFLGEFSFKLLNELKHPVVIDDIFFSLQQASFDFNEQTFEDVNSIAVFKKYGRLNPVAAMRSLYEFEIYEERFIPILITLLLQVEHADISAAAAKLLRFYDVAQSHDALLNVSHRFDDEWFLAFNVLESLGYMQVQKARPIMEKIFKEHWFEPVRNNAKRGLNALDAGIFSLDIQKEEVDISLTPWSRFKYRADLKKKIIKCTAQKRFWVKQIPVERISFPRKKPVEVEPIWSSRSRNPEAFKKIISKLAEDLPQDTRLTFYHEKDKYEIFAVIKNSKSSVFLRKEGGKARLIFKDDILTGLHINEQIIFISSPFIDGAKVWVLELSDEGFKVKQRLSLSISPNKFYVAPKGAIILSDGDENNAISYDGDRLVLTEAVVC